MTGYYAADGALVKDLRLIARKYVTGPFWLDCLITSFDWVALILQGAPKSMGLLRAGRVVRIFRMARALRLMRLSKMRKLMVQEARIFDLK